MILLARPLLSAIVPLLAAHTDSTSPIRPGAAPAPTMPAPVSAPAIVASGLSTLGGSDASRVLASAVASLARAATAPARAAAAAPVAAAPAAPAVLSDGRVPMPAWAVGASTGLMRAGRADSVVVEKGEHRMTLYGGGQALGSFLVALGQRQGVKEKAGDLRTPEGLYHIDARNPNSRFHLALHVSYPNAADVARARALGVSTGGDIMIHGLPNGQGAAGSTHREYDWTNGCVAVTDQEIEQIWGAVPVGTPVRIRP